jgi:AraC-like DNA-binding protein
MSTEERARAWLAGLGAAQFRQLFDHLPGTLFFAKDRRGLLMLGNPAFLRRCGLRDESELVGKRDDELFPPRLAAKYRRDDLHVMRTGKPLAGIIELFPGDDGLPEWFVTDKLPLRTHAGKIAGLCGIVRSYAEQHAAIQPYLELAAAAEHLRTHSAKPLEVARLAAMAGMSVRQFERKFKSTFQTTPRAYLIQMRVLHASRLLRTTTHTLTQIALEVGFYDHSDFTRHFQKHLGISPGTYRRGSGRRESSEGALPRRSSRRDPGRAS